MREGGGTQEGAHTGLIYSRFEAAGECPQIFISGGKSDDSEQRYDERKGTRDMPPAEYETQVFRTPGEEHLSRFNWRQRSRDGGESKKLPTCIEQVGPFPPPGAISMEEEWCML